MWRNGGDLHCKCQQYLKWLFLMQKLLAISPKKKMGGLSSPQGLLQASHRVYLLPALKAGRLGCLCTLKWPRQEAVIFQVVYTSHLPQNPAHLHVPAGSSKVWMSCLRDRGQRAAAVLYLPWEPWAVPISSGGHTAATPPASTAAGPGHQLQLLGIDWVRLTDILWSLPGDCTWVPVPP